MTESEDLYVESGKELAILAVLAYWGVVVKPVAMTEKKVLFILILVPLTVNLFCPPYTSDGEGWQKAEEQREEPWKLFNITEILIAKKYDTHAGFGYRPSIYMSIRFTQLYSFNYKKYFEKSRMYHALIIFFARIFMQTKHLL